MDIHKVMIYGNKKNCFRPKQEAGDFQGHDNNANPGESHPGSGSSPREDIIKWTAQTDNETPQVESSGFYGW